MKVTFGVKSTWYGSVSCKRLGGLSVKACVGGLRRQPSWGCSQRCRPLWGNQTAPTILWQRSPAGDTLDSFGSARSCRNRESLRVCTEGGAGPSYRSLRCDGRDPLSYHLSMHFWQKLCAQGRMRSAFPSMQIQHSSSSVSCFTLNRKQTSIIFSRTQFFQKDMYLE